DHLVDVDGGLLPHDREVDRLPGLVGQHPGDRSGLLDQVQPRAGGAGQAHQPDTQPEPPATLDLLDEVALLQRGEQPAGGALVDAQVTRDLGDPGLPAAGQQLQDADRPVHRLHRALCAVPDPAVLLAGLHGATIAAVTTPAAAPVTDELVLVLSCPDQPGIVARVATVLYEHGANIEESQQFDDPVTDHFFMRVRFSVPVGGGDLTEWRERLAPVAGALRMDWDLRRAAEPYRTLVLVSKAGHSLNDLLYRWRTGGLYTHLVAVVSNHTDYEPLDRAFDVPFHSVPVTPDTKQEAESRLLGLVSDLRVDLVVLARYMQILSDDLTRAMSGRIINIHHSFLPSFKGARPYHQAFARGVK